MERADGLLRIMRAHYILSLDKGINSDLTWQPILRIFTSINDSEIAVLENDTAATLHFLLTDTANLNSLKAILTRARENARGVQDHLTKEVWEQVNQMYHMVNSSNISSRLSGYDALETLENFSKNSLLFMGVTDVTMPRGLGWSFMNLGRYIERCTQTIEITDRQYKSINYNLENVIDIIQWQYLLLSLSGFELHVKTYQSSNYNKNVLHQVILNEDFPRSVLYSLNHINRYLDDVTGENKSEQTEEIKRFYGRFYNEIKYIDFDKLRGETLGHCLQSIRANMIEFSQYLTQNFFSYN
jgi:uncharacterized alpha-E superfamily protein